MAGTSYFWQGGQKIEVTRAPRTITIHAADREAALAAGRNAGVELQDAKLLAPGVVMAEVAVDRDAAMARLRASNVVHHVYRDANDDASEFVITDTFFVKFRPTATEASIQEYLQDERLVLEKDLGDKLLLVRVTNDTGRNPMRTANSAAVRDDVEYAEPNLMREVVRCGFIPADPLFSRQWHLHAPAAGSDLALGAGIFAPDAWELTRGSRDVVIAVADDGFDVTHPDFQGDRKLAGRWNVTVSGAGITFDDDVSPRPGDYHGTPCAGVALAEINGQGTVGVAPGCAFLPVRFPLSMPDSHFILMFDTISRAADVVSCSWGVGPANAPMSSALRDRITQLAASGGRRGKGLVICIAAGNNNCPVLDPKNKRTYEFLDRNGIVRSYSGPIDRWIAAHPSVITVSGATSLKTRSAFSSWGKSICVCAPTDNWDDMQRVTVRGRGVTTTDNEGFGRGTDFTPGSRYTPVFGGTSSATPTVAGVCGLVISRNPSLTAAEVRRILEQTADKDLVISSETAVNEPGDFVNGFSLWFGHGKVNAARAVKAAAPADRDTTVDVTSTAKVAIPDAGATVSSSVDVAERGVITDLRVSVNISHTYVGDLRVDLVAPDGSAVTLHDNAGGSTRDLVKLYGVADVPGLRAFVGKRVEGTWRLRVTDRWVLDVGTLNSWRLVAKVGAGVAPMAHAAHEQRILDTTRVETGIMPSSKPLEIEYRGPAQQAENGAE